VEKVSKELWFPSSGYIHCLGSQRSDVFMAGKIIVNQGPTKEHLDIDFPPGSKVWDEIRDLEYVVKPANPY